MTEHLPIQRWTKIFTRYPASEVLPNESGDYVTYADHIAAYEDVKKRAYLHGLDAAREAVRNECFHDTDSEWCVFAAAIDALREKQ